MAGNDTSATQDQRSGSTASTLNNRELPTTKANKGNGSKPATGNGKTSKYADGEMKDMTHPNDANNNTSTNTSGSTSRHPPRLPTRTNKTKRKSASTTTTNTSTGPTPPQPSSTSRSAPSVTHHHRALNPLLLARGMSSRYLSTKIISASSSSSNSSTPTPTSILPLSKTDIEKDLRHMEAHRAASIGYGQQLFVYKNQELVRSGYFGSFFVGPGVLEDGSGGGEHVGGDGYYHPAVVDDTIRAPYHDEVDQEGAGLIDKGGYNEDPRAPTRPVVGKRGSQRKHLNRGRPYMPIKIDPEEEKRLSGLRKRMHHSEFVRMQLETQYLSLRSHYVHESQLVRKTRSYEMDGRLQLMREVMVRREKVLALMRVKMAIWRDVEVRLMGYRDGWNVGGTEDPIVANKNDASSAAAGEKAEEESKEAVENEADAENKKVDLLKIWNDINSQLKAAESACMELETPAVLTQMVVTPTPSSPSSSASSATSIAKNGRKRSSSITSTEEAANNNNDSTSGKRRVSSSSSSGLEPHIIPWDCMVEPQTPYDLPLLLSCLSSATDRVAGYVTDRNNPSAITWLESTLPQTTSAYDNDAEDLKKLQEEVRALEDELQRECVRNTELREQVNASRTRSDEMVALMQLLRSEMEAVLERHNVIMETPEAIAKAAELHQRRVEEEKLKNPPVEGEDEEEEEEDDEEGEVDENEEFSSGEEEINRYEQQESDDELYDSVGIKEITVDNDSNNEAGESDDDDEDGSDGGDVAEDEDGEEEEPRTRSKRRGHEDEDDMSNSSSTPPNSSSYRKRRRY